MGNLDNENVKVLHENHYPYVFTWKNNPKRKELRGKRLRVIAKGAKGSIEVEFENGHHEIISRRSIRRVK